MLKSGVSIMPNYVYKCKSCENKITITLPISTDPKLRFPCVECGCESKRIIVSGAQWKGFKTFAGDWFKKTYGFDMADPYMDKVRQKEDYETMATQLKRETS